MKKNVLYALVAAMLVSAIYSCRSVKYVPVEKVRRDTLYINKVRRDSIVKYDSVHVRDKGDTVWLEKYRYLFVDKWRTDTLYVNLRMEVGGWALLLLLAAGAYGLWRLWKKRK